MSIEAAATGYKCEGIARSPSLATILRDWSFRWAPLYEAIAWGAALLAGGEAAFRKAAWQTVAVGPGMDVLDLCCGPGGATRYLAATGARVVGLDFSERSLAFARARIPQATFVQGRAEALPFANASFDLVHVSVALHEMESLQLEAIFAEVRRVLRPDGQFVLIDYHRPTNSLFWPGLALFLWLFETHTAWDLIACDLGSRLERHGLVPRSRELLAGGSLQIIRAG